MKSVVTVAVQFLQAPDIKQLSSLFIGHRTLTTVVHRLWLAARV